ncbi:DNA mismatch repair proteinC-terminal [Penicillium lividum]|nr:DNA mismatch repair proteinC-terminal [Penicillium lividum]
MPIEALPPATVKAIGSTSVISDPCSVVKELIDNALDAGSTSLVIEISSNTVDVIQVKDNGHGIPTEDHPYVCRHTFTSKIQTLDDLRNVGGMSFGFRGEALASVAEMSGGMTITTRIASEATGSCLKYERDGQLFQSQRSAHPVGTTVRIVHFLKHIPVRRQLVLKSAPKILTRIKKLLQAYAVAQTLKRFSLKVLKAKNENNNWMYAPSPDATLYDAAIKIFGRELSSCCVTKKLSPDSSAATQCRFDNKEYDVLAFLPKPDSECNKTNNSGQFISVDGRPLSAATGFGQDIAKLFKSYIRAASKNEVTRSITDPFLIIQLSCPRGSYDVNIEPGKDDVLFEDRDIMLSLVESLFDELYGPLPDSQSRRAAKDKCSRVQRSDEFDIMLARRPANELSTESTQKGTCVQPTVPIPLIHGTPHPETQPQTTTPFASQKGHDDTAHTESRGSRFVNPWSVTAMNASLRTPRQEIAPQPVSPELLPSSEHVRPPPSRRPTQQLSPDTPELLTPVSRFVSTSPINRRRQPPSQESQVSPTQTNSTGDSRKAARQRDKERYGNGALDTWFTRTTQVYLGEEPTESTAAGEEIPSISQLAGERFGNQTESPGLEEASINADDLGRREDASENQISPPNQHIEAVHQGSMDSGRGFPVLERWAASLREDFNPETQSEVDKALDFERRKKEAIRNHRARQANNNTPSSSQTSTAISHSPHHNRFLKAKAALASDRPFAPLDSTNALSPNDPRAYLIRQNTRESGNEKARRLPTNKLPFENIPEGYDTHSIGLSMSTDLSDVKKSFNLIALHDSYVRDEKEHTLSASTVESLVPVWNERLNAIIKKKYKAKNESRAPAFNIDVSLFIDHLNRYNS